MSVSEPWGIGIPEGGNILPPLARGGGETETDLSSLSSSSLNSTLKLSTLSLSLFNSSQVSRPLKKVSETDRQPGPKERETKINCVTKGIIGTYLLRLQTEEHTREENEQTDAEAS